MRRPRAKTFDCVEMKNRIQAEIFAEYEAQEDEFPSFSAFVKARTDKSEWVRQMREKFGGPGSPKAGE